MYFFVLCSLYSRCSFWVQMYLFMLSIHMLIQATVSGKVSLTNYTVRVSCVCPVFRYFDDILLSTSLDSLFLTSLHRLCFPWCWWRWGFSLKASTQILQLDGFKLRCPVFMWIIYLLSPANCYVLDSEPKFLIRELSGRDWLRLFCKCTDFHRGSKYIWYLDA